MRPAIQLLAAPGFPGFWRRSLDEFKRVSQIAIKFEGLYPPADAMSLWQFDSPSSVLACKDMSDNDIGGSSQAKLDFVPESAAGSAHLLFSGSISNDLPSNDPKVERTGYAAFRTRDRPATMFGKALWDVDRYTYLALRIKSDGRKYKVNIQTESIVYTDIHQHRIYARRPGHWETVLIKWSDFVRTNHGMVVEPQSDMIKDKVRTIGIGLTDRLAGPFEMRISRIWATNGLNPQDLEESEQPEARYVPKHFDTLASSTISKERERR